jgi:hypothetical protein
LAAAFEDERPVQLRQRRGERGDGGATPDRGAVAVAADEQRRHVDGSLPERGEVLPVAVDVAVPVERAAEPGVLELTGVHVEIGLGQPVGHRVGVVEAIAHLGAPGDRRHRADRGVGWRGVARCGVHEPAEPAAHVGLDLGLGAPRFLEVLDVELLVTGHRPHGGQRPYLRGRRVGHRQPGDGGEDVRPQQCGGPRDRRAPVVADDRRLVRPERADEPDVVGDEADHPVVLDGERL